MDSVAVFTDTYLPTVNGVTYTIESWRDHWTARGGRMDVVYPGADGHDPEPGEHPVRSLPFPFYDGFRLGLPRVPRGVRDVDVVHAHTPFGLGLAGARLAWRSDRPLVASYHTPTSEYATYLTARDSVANRIEGVSERYERWYYGRADAVLVPSATTRDHLVDVVGVDAPVVVLPNGVDVDRFRPVHPGAFRRRHDLGDGTLVGYTGRHGYEKRLGDILEAVARLDRDLTVVFGGDGPARADLEERAADLDVDTRFLGFLDREELPEFYSALDVFTFPSPVETQGLVALEANACGTPVVGVASGALANTVDDGETGFHYDPEDVEGFAAAIERALDERARLSEACLSRRNALSVENTVDDLVALYEDVQ